jgi:hypothetical protein
MTRNIIIITLLIVVIVLLVYYFKPSSLTLDAKGVTLQVKEKTFLLESRTVKTTPLTYKNVDIMQTKLSNGTFYEMATTEALYEFNGDIKTIIKSIFEAQKVERIFSKRGVDAFQVTLKNAQVVNLFTQCTDPKELKLFYGIPYDEFLPIIKEIMKSKFEVIPVGGLLELAVPLTNWDIVRGDIGGDVIVSMDH